MSRFLIPVARQGDELGAPLDGIPDGDVDLGDAPRSLGLDLVFHLHRLHDQERLPGDDLVPRLHEELHHAPRHRTLEDLLAGPFGPLLRRLRRARALALDAHIRAVPAGDGADLRRRPFGREIDDLPVDPHRELPAHGDDVDVDRLVCDPHFERAARQLLHVDDDRLGAGRGIERDVVAHGALTSSAGGGASLAGSARFELGFAS